MTFSSDDQVAIRRAFDLVIGGLGPSRDLGAVVERAGRVAMDRTAPVQGVLVALAIGSVVAVGVAVMLFLGGGDPTMPGDLGSSPGPGVSLPVVSVPAPTSTTTTTTTAQGQEDTRRATAELMACMAGTWEFDLAAYQEELQQHLDPEADVVVVTAVSGGGLLVIEPEMRFTLTYTDLVIRFEFPGGIGPATNELRVSGEIRSTFRLNRTVFLPGPVDDQLLIFYRTIAGYPDATFADLPPAFRDASLRLGTSGSPSQGVARITIECGGTRLVVRDRRFEDVVDGDGPAAIWIRRQG